MISNCIHCLKRFFLFGRSESNVTDLDRRCGDVGIVLMVVVLLFEVELEVDNDIPMLVVSLTLMAVSGGGTILSTSNF